MKHLDVELTRNGQSIGTLTLDGEKVQSSNADIQAIYESAKPRFGGPSEAFEALTNFSNGYVTFRPR